MGSKKAVMDFYIIIFVGITMVFFVVVMSAISSGLGRSPQAGSFMDRASTHMLSRFLETPAQHVMEGVPDITMAEYIGLVLDGEGPVETHDGFEDFMASFRHDLCQWLGVSENLCSIEIVREDCRRHCIIREGNEHVPVAQVRFIDMHGGELFLVLHLHEDRVSAPMRSL